MYMRVVSTAMLMYMRVVSELCSILHCSEQFILDVHQVIIFGHSKLACCD